MINTDVRNFIKAIAVDTQRAAKIAVVSKAIDALKIALAGYESELARLTNLPPHGAGSYPAPSPEDAVIEPTTAAVPIV